MAELDELGNLLMYLQSQNVQYAVFFFAFGLSVGAFLPAILRGSVHPFWVPGMYFVPGMLAFSLVLFIYNTLTYKQPFEWGMLILHVVLLMLLFWALYVYGRIQKSIKRRKTEKLH